MGIIYSSLKRKTEEEQSHFDRRISQMLPVMAGYCYFDIKNYDTFSGEYNLYIDWDMELMEYLAYPLPSGGYFVKVTSEQADDFNELGEGVPVYMKLIGKNGQIYSYRTYLVYRGRPYSIEFSGAELIPFEEKIQKCMIGGSQRPGMSITGSQRFSIGGSQRLGMGVTGSQRFSIGGSQRPDMSITGSQRFSIGGSQRLGMGVTGSQRFSIGGSQRPGMGVTGSQRFSIGGSQRPGMSVTGSQRFNMGGSQRHGMGVTGSQRFSIGGSQRHGMGVTGSQRHVGSQRPTIMGKLPEVYTPTEDWTMIPKEWQLINRTRRPDTDKGGNARLGYGLDLI
ncbi:hypothetical protein [Coprococcus sp. OM04-5BH]|uniref:hypothetical protein n=1 Tax=Coprococcus sp. OM04-5BH TaxID=2293093 RepID=UPI0011C225D9|nr:hypothetical protein [Coprococcus sp. OM04-5BH]